MQSIPSIVVLIAVAGIAYLSVRMLRAMLTRWALWVVVAALWCASIAAIGFVDVNIPLSESHLRPSGLPAPSWLAVAAMSVRFAALSSIFITRQTLRQPVTEPNNRLQPIAHSAR